MFNVHLQKTAHIHAEKLQNEESQNLERWQSSMLKTLLPTKIKPQRAATMGNHSQTENTQAFFNRGCVWWNAE